MENSTNTQNRMNNSNQADYKRIHHELNSMIGLLDSKIDSMIGKHEKDFMTAYRVTFNIVFFN